jgi:hypothetical protein
MAEEGAHNGHEHHGGHQHSGEHGHTLEEIEDIEHAGRRIVVRTRYEIEIDGKQVKTHMWIRSDGRFVTHALPYFSFSSPREMAEALAEYYSADF